MDALYIFYLRIIVIAKYTTTFSRQAASLIKRFNKSLYQKFGDQIIIGEIDNESCLEKLYISLWLIVPARVILKFIIKYSEVFDLIYLPIENISINSMLYMY